VNGSTRRAAAPILYLCRADVEEVLPAIDVLAIVDRVLLAHADGRAALPPESYLEWVPVEGGRARSLAMPGAVDGMVGTKIINANPHNVTVGLARADGLTILFDPSTARVDAILAAAPISALRTAAVTVIAARVLGAARIPIVGIVGAGEMAAAHAQLLTSALPHLREIRVYDVDDDRAHALVDRPSRAREDRHVRWGVSPTAEAAIRGSLLVVPVTTTDRGYIPREWLRPGSLVVNVSLDDLLETTVLTADRLFVDDWDLVRADARRLLGRLVRDGRVVGPGDAAPPGVRAIDGTLGDVLRGRVPGRIRDEDVIVLNPFGMAIFDVAVAGAVARSAEARGIGRALRR
jgi:ornithine cyclodeaminase